MKTSATPTRPRSGIFSPGGMRVALGLAFLFAALVGGEAASFFSPRPRAPQDRYFPLPSWCERNGFTMSWRSKGEFSISDGRNTVRFDLDNRKTYFNGVCVWFSFPVVVQDGRPFISETDLRKVVEPLTSRVKIKGRIGVICIDPGHGGKDPGKQYANHSEKDFTLALAQEVSQLLRAAGYKVIYTRSSDSYRPRGDRIQLANDRGADLFLSLHFNAADTRDAEGVEVYCMTPAGARSTSLSGGTSSTAPQPGNTLDAKNVVLAYEMQQTLVRLLPAPDRGVRRARYDVLANAKMPAILVEGGFMTNSGDLRKIRDKGYRRKMARAICEGIRAFQIKLETKG